MAEAEDGVEGAISLCTLRAARGIEVTIGACIDELIKTS